MGIAASLAASLLFSYSLVHAVRLLHASRPSSPAKSVAIVVLGDVARSPRMCRHARSFLKRGWSVELIGYLATPLPDDLANHPHLRLHDVRPPRFLSPSAPLPRLVFLLLAPLKIISTSILLLKTLSLDLRPGVPGWVLVQNPPAIPTLPIVQLFGYCCRARVVVDWHNTAYSVLAMRFGGDEGHPVVRLAKWIECLFGRDAAAHIFVTHAEKEALLERWKLRGRPIVFYDRPPEDFKRLQPGGMHAFWTRLLSELSAKDSSLPGTLSALSPASTSPPGPRSSPFTAPTSPSTNTVPTTTAPTATSGAAETGLVPSRPPVELREDRPAVLVSSTSWTADEDFDMLIDALSLYARTEVAPSEQTKPSDIQLQQTKSSMEAQQGGEGGEEELERRGAKGRKVGKEDVGEDWVDAARADSSEEEVSPPTSLSASLSASPFSSSFTAISAPSASASSASPSAPASSIRLSALTSSAPPSVQKSAVSLPSTSSTKLPDLICFITGRGPLQEHYRSLLSARASSENWLHLSSRSATSKAGTRSDERTRPRVAVHIIWLEEADYPRLLGCADVGVSLHVSSSGLDLPMKVVDAFGCGLPVCARRFDCVEELVKPGVNGHLFSTAEELADQLRSLLADFPSFPSELDLLRAGITSAIYGPPASAEAGREDLAEGRNRERKWESWEEEWERVLAPVFKP